MRRYDGLDVWRTCGPPATTQISRVACRLGSPLALASSSRGCSGWARLQGRGDEPPRNAAAGGEVHNGSLRQRRQPLRHRAAGMLTGGGYRQDAGLTAEGCSLRGAIAAGTDLVRRLNRHVRSLRERASRQVPVEPARAQGATSPVGNCGSHPQRLCARHIFPPRTRSGSHAPRLLREEPLVRGQAPRAPQCRCERR